MRQGDLIWAIIYLVFGLYFVNSAIIFYELPEQVSIVNKWLTLVGGVLILIGGLQHLRASRAIRRFRAR